MFDKSIKLLHYLLEIRLFDLNTELVETGILRYVDCTFVLESYANSHASMGIPHF